MVTRLTPFRRQVSSIPDDLERAPRQTAGAGVVVRGARRIGGWLRQCVAFSGLHHFHFLPLRTGGTPKGGSKSPILTEGRMTPASTAGLSIEEFISTFVTYKYIRLRHPQWLGLTHFVLRLLLIVGYSECPTFTRSTLFLFTKRKSRNFFHPFCKFTRIRALRFPPTFPIGRDIRASCTRSETDSSYDAHTRQPALRVCVFITRASAHDWKSTHARASTFAPTATLLTAFILFPTAAHSPLQKNSWTVRDLVS